MGREETVKPRREFTAVVYNRDTGQGSVLVGEFATAEGFVESIEEEDEDLSVVAVFSSRGFIAYRAGG